MCSLLATRTSISEDVSMHSGSSKNQGFPCPHCGEYVPAGARVCRECGASDECGWDVNDDPYRVPPDEDEFDYDDFVAREFPDHSAADSPTRLKRARMAWIVVALVGALILGIVL